MPLSIYFTSLYYSNLEMRSWFIFKISIFAAFLLISFNTLAQQTINILIQDSAGKYPIPGATVMVESTRQGNFSDQQGKVILQNIPQGDQKIIITMIGYKTQSFDITIPTEKTEFHIFLASSISDLDAVTISVTRSNSRIETSSTKVEVLGKDEMDEENAIKPGNVASILGDVSGIQLQQSSAISGNMNVRIQGLDGKYTQILRDGLPLFEGFSGGFGVMQVPPLDLKQIEIIKGSASTLYGGGAISGIINLVSKTPGKEPEAMITLNQSTLKESNINAFYSSRNKRLGTTLFAGFTNQYAVDVNKDGFSDVPKLESMMVHPRFFYYFNDQTTLSIGLSSVNEKREGGDMLVLKERSDSTHTFFEQDISQRYTADINFEMRSAKGVFSVKGCSGIFDLSSGSNTSWFGAIQINSYGELSYLMQGKTNDLVLGINCEAEQLNTDNADKVLFKGHTNNTLGAFAQNTFKWKDKYFADIGLRTDYDDAYGWFVLPRIAGLVKLNKFWYTRMGFGMGYKTPELMNTGVKELDPSMLMPFSAFIKSERSLGANFELNYSAVLDKDISLLVNQAFFYTAIHSPLVVNQGTNGFYYYTNDDQPVVTKGSDTYIRMSIPQWEFYLGYTYTLPLQDYNEKIRYVTYTPLHRAAATVVYEIESKWRFGLESSYNGYQYRDDGSKTRGYFFLAAMAERKFGKLSIVLNGENLLDFRQTRFESIIIPPVNNPTFKTLWAPIDGRVINLSVVCRL